MWSVIETFPGHTQLRFVHFILSLLTTCILLERNTDNVNDFARKKHLQRK